MNNTIETLKKDARRLKENPDYFDKSAKYSAHIMFDKNIEEIKNKETANNCGILKKFLKSL